MTAYYNEIDPYAAQWLRNLIAAGHIAPGEVDTRSIEDVQPDDLREFTQCHFFAGIGVWSHALRSAGWPDDRPVWTGSCPCQPFSAAGKGAAFADERHLWPAFHHLIKECKPECVIGEQVASSVVDDWIDLVHADLEALGYAFGSVPFPSAGVGAPHIRDRNYWVGSSLARAHDARLEGRRVSAKRALELFARTGGVAGGLADTSIIGQYGRRTGKASDGRNAARVESERLCDAIGLADPIVQQRPNRKAGIGAVDAEAGRLQGAAAVTGLCSDMRPGPTNGFWRNADWLGCRDGKWRPVIASHVQMVDGPTTSMVRVCTEQDQKGEIDNAELQTLQETLDAEKIQQRSFGIAIDARPPPVLRPEVHGLGNGGGGQGSDREEQPKAISQNGTPTVRDVPGSREAACPSQGRKPYEQCGVELDDLVPLLPSSLSLAELHGDRRTAEGLRILQRSICEARPVLYAPESVQAIWARLSKEEKDRIRLGFDAARWRKLVAFPLELGAKNRTGRLKGYGNAINAEAARVFIECVMECQP